MDSSTGDASLRADELEALTSIYGDDLVEEKSSAIDNETRLYSMTIRNESKSIELRLFVKLPPTYPSSSPPSFEISSPYLDGKAKRALSTRLQQIYADNLGQPILFHWFEAARQFLDDRGNENDSDGDDGKDEDGFVGDAPSSIDADHLSTTTGTNGNNGSSSCPRIDPSTIESGDSLTDRRSTFQAHLAPILTKDDVRHVLAYLKQTPKIARATHNMYAYRIHDGGRICIQDCEDDGEQQAGSRLLHLLDMMDARNVLIVVTRWYGGTHLGPDRFKHISNVARELLEKNGYGKQAGMDAANKKGEKKK